jgi:hypothetical protein
MVLTTGAMNLRIAGPWAENRTLGPHEYEARVLSTLLRDCV